MSQFPPAPGRGGMQGSQGERMFEAEDQERIKGILRKKLGPEHISTRQAMGGSRLSYVEGWRVISIANEVFGFDGWRSSIQTLNIDFLDAVDGRFSAAASCVMRITLRDGTFREDVGFGVIENVKSKGQALEKVKKEATTDALKRAMRQFGNVLGNCLYDKDYVRNLTQVQKQARNRISGDALYRYSDLEGRAGPAAGNQSEDDMEFDMLDDPSVFDMMDGLESNRPIIFESPSFGFVGSMVGRQQQQQQQPPPPPQQQQQQQQQQTPAHPARTAMPNSGGSGGSNSSSGPGAVQPPRVAADGTPMAARNLAFRPPPAPAHPQGTPVRPPANGAQGRPRSFAEITTFTPSASPGSGRPGPQQQQQPGPR
ncbi:DNA repair protein rad52 [Coemansia javaensis]|uniref:DNA repair protein rad52 n=1 Tax=Coemansia javaensis TaxID=2761396 RepID=A0A9W8HEI2_9FUNG|nr:DNA repair protein rad52 [Coemansia javaensis]